MRFDIRASSLPEYYKESLLAASHHLITSEGVIVIKAQEYRSREMNREAALSRLAAVIKELTAVQKSPGNTSNAGIERTSVVIEGAEIHRKVTAWQSPSSVM